MKVIVIKSARITYWYPHNHITNHIDEQTESKWIVGVSNEKYERLKNPSKDPNKRYLDILLGFGGGYKKPSNERCVTVNNNRREILLRNEYIDMDIFSFRDATFEEEFIYLQSIS